MYDNQALTKLYEYAVIRLVPKVEREEFINVGIILYCANVGFLQARYEINQERLKAFCSELDMVELEQYLETWEKICVGNKKNGVIASLPIASRFRWLTATRSTIIQTSKVHPGFCENPEQKLQLLFNELVAS